MGSISNVDTLYCIHIWNNVLFVVRVLFSTCLLQQYLYPYRCRTIIVFNTCSPCRWSCLAHACLSTKKKTLGLLFILFGHPKLIYLWEFETLSKKTTWSLSSFWKFFLKCYPAKQIHYSSSLLINCTASLFYFKVTFVKNLMPKRIRCLFLKLWWEQDALRPPQLANKNHFSKACI